MLRAEYVGGPDLVAICAADNRAVRRLLDQWPGWVETLPRVVDEKSSQHINHDIAGGSLVLGAVHLQQAR